MNLLNEIYMDLPEGRIEKICIGSHWTAVVSRQNGYRRCGLASNPFREVVMSEPFKSELDSLEDQDTVELSRLEDRHPSPLSSAWVASINAMLPRQPERWVDANAGEVIASKGSGKRVALVGHFPFVPELREQVGELHVLELNPKEGDLHADQAPRVIPQCGVVAITSMALVNGTMEGLLELCSPEAYVIVLGPSTPLSPLLFDRGVDMLCGSIVENIDPVVDSVLNGDSFRQIKKNGVRLVTIEK